MATRWYRAPEIMLNWMHYNQTGSINLYGSSCVMGPGQAGQLTKGPGRVPCLGGLDTVWGQN